MSLGRDTPPATHRCAGRRPSSPKRPDHPAAPSCLAGVEPVLDQRRAMASRRRQQHGAARDLVAREPATSSEPPSPTAGSPPVQRAWSRASRPGTATAATMVAHVVDQHARLSHLTRDRLLDSGARRTGQRAVAAPAIAPGAGPRGAVAHEHDHDRIGPRVVVRAATGQWRCRPASRLSLGAPHSRRSGGAVPVRQRATRAIIPPCARRPGRGRSRVARHRARRQVGGEDRPPAAVDAGARGRAPGLSTVAAARRRRDHAVRVGTTTRVADRRSAPDPALVARRARASALARERVRRRH